MTKLEQLEHIIAVLRALPPWEGKKGALDNLAVVLHNARFDAGLLFDAPEEE